MRLDNDQCGSFIVIPIASVLCLARRKKGAMCNEMWLLYKLQVSLFADM